MSSSITNNPPNYDRFMDLMGKFFRDEITEKQFDTMIAKIPNADELAIMFVDLFRV